MMTLRELNEALIEHNCVLNIAIDIEKNSLKYNLMISLGRSEESKDDKLIVYFYDISQLEIKNFGGGLVQFMHLKVDEESSGLDRVNYALQDLEDNKVFFYFESFDVL